MATIFLIRHAETDYVGKAIAGRAPDIHLNRVGVTQADSLPSRIDRVPLAAIYSSPLERAIETAEPLAARRKLPVIRRDALTEIDFGAWTGCTLASLDELTEWRLFNSFRSIARTPGGESMLEAQSRMVAELGCIASRHDGEAVAAISHCDMIRATIAHYVGIPLDLMLRFEIAPASVSILRITTASAVLVRLNDTGEHGA